MEMNVEAFVRLLANEAHPFLPENELRADIRGAMREETASQIRDALANAIKAGRLEVRSLIARIPFALAPTAEINPIDWLVSDEAQTVARALLGRPGPRDDTTPAESKDKPMPTQRWQESRIHEVMRELGITLESLPPVINGKRGVAADIRDLLRERDGIWKWSDTVFEKAWKRVRTN
jgi:hypothetical protein